MIHGMQRVHAACEMLLLDLQSRFEPTQATAILALCIGRIAAMQPQFQKHEQAWEVLAPKLEDLHRQGFEYQQEYSKRIRTPRNT
ncbi:Uncharacterised protein [uncultured archaeon]|nr:Uncharacterised protein [uncultured archaeon]